MEAAPQIEQGFPVVPISMHRTRDMVCAGFVWELQHTDPNLWNSALPLYGRNFGGGRLADRGARPQIIQSTCLPTLSTPHLTPYNLQPSRSAVVSRSKRTAFSTSGELYLGCRLCRAGCETAAKPVSFFCTRVMVQCKVQRQGLTMPSQLFLRCQIAEIWERRVIIDSKGLQCQQKRTRGLLSSVYSARVL